MDAELFLLSLVLLCMGSIAAPPPVLWLGIDVVPGRELFIVPMKFCLNCTEFDMSESSMTLTVPAQEVYHFLNHEPSSSNIKDNTTLKMKINNEVAYLMQRVKRFARSSNTSFTTDSKGHHRRRRSTSSILNWTSEFLISFVDQVVRLVLCDPNVEFPSTLEEIRNLTDEELVALSCSLNIVERTKLKAGAFVEAVSYVFSMEGARETAENYLENIRFYQLPDLILNMGLVAWEGTFLVALPLAIEAFNNNPGGDARDFALAMKFFFLGP